MRTLPFFKPKKGVQFAGEGVADTSGGGGGGGYTLPPATASTLGGVKVGSGLSVESDGTLSASGGGGGSTDVYSTSEVECGVWRQPVSGVLKQKKRYRKTIIIDNPDLNGSRPANITSEMSNVELAWHTAITWVCSNGAIISGTFKNSDTDRLLSTLYKNSSNNWFISSDVYNGIGQPNKLYYVIEYIKSSDEWETV